MVKVVLIDTPKVVVKLERSLRVAKMGWDRKERKRERGGRQEVREGSRR